MAVLGEVDVGVVGGEDGVGGTDDGAGGGGGHGEWIVSGGVGGVDKWWLYLWCVFVCWREFVCCLSAGLTEKVGCLSRGVRGCLIVSAGVLPSATLMWS